jgi:DMSO/TMAO reductase YedYZ molybdopterin-dependent catalytic subunit
MEEERYLSKLPKHPAPASNPERCIRLVGPAGRTMSLDADDLVALPQHAITEDFICEEGWRVPQQTWSGVRVGDLLDKLGVNGKSLWVEFASGDFRFSAPTATARNALVGLSLDGLPLTHAHGGPYRLYVPGAACYTSIKWLDRIEVCSAAGRNSAGQIAGNRLLDVRGESQEGLKASSCSASGENC